MEGTSGANYKVYRLHRQANQSPSPTPLPFTRLHSDRPKTVIPVKTGIQLAK
jgi:hypothetical protein